MPVLFSFTIIFKSEVRPYLVKCILYIEIKNSRNLNRLFANVVAEDQCCKPVKKIVWELTMLPFRNHFYLYFNFRPGVHGAPAASNAASYCDKSLK